MNEMVSPATALSDRTTVEVDAVARRCIVLVPVGACEQHGPHLPLDTDTRIAVTLVDRVARREPDRVVAAPAVPYGASGEHAGFAGTLSIGTDALTTMLVEIGRSADAFEKVVFVNGHGGNVTALAASVELLRREGRRAHAWSWSVTGADAHAGRTETSLMLAIEPSAVRLEAAERGRTEPVAELIDELRTAGVRAVSPNGVLGDPAGATRQEGEQLLERLADDLAAFLAAL